ncbi:MAG: glycosyltransferase family 4 protein [Planctomycetota bacterium]
MRIQFVVHQFLPRHAAGTEIYTYHLARELGRRGHEVSIYTTEIRPDRPQYELRRTEHDGLPIWEAVHNHAFPSFRRTYLDRRQEENFARVLDETRPDLVHFQHLHLHSIGYVDVARARGLPIVYTLHEYILMCLRGGQLLPPEGPPCRGPDPELCAVCARELPAPTADEAPLPGPVEARVKAWLPGPLRRLVRRLRPGPAPAAAVAVADADPYRAAVELRLAEVRRRLDDVDLFVSPSAFLRERFIANGFIRPERILHSDNGFFVEPFADVRRSTSDELRVGFVGTIAPYKGVHLLVEAFQGLDRPGISCRIWGDLDTFPDYKARLLAMDRPANLEFAGRFDNSRIAEVLADIDLLVVPSIWFENSPLTIHEAFLAGIPVLTADEGGMAELVTDGVDGLHFRMGDAADLRARLERLLHEPALLAGMRRFPAIKTIAEDTDLMERRYEALLAGKVPTA